jgi:acetylornithine deacetylase/succinyl-diaminopimelate desuccinylase-like protein
VDNALQHAKQRQQDYQDQLIDLLKIPSVSTDSAYAKEVRRAGEWVVADMESIGLTAELIETDRHPLVYGEWLGAGDDKPTVLFYGHYDVQPASLEDGWDNEPFDPIEKDGFIYARGASDDKGQFLIHLKAVESILKSEGTLPVNVKFIIEGEEESGGESVEDYVINHSERLQADAVVVSDTSMATTDEPVIVVALRGGLSMELHVSGPKSDLHSGSYGGVVHNPAQALAEIIGKFHDADGTITVPGFYDNVKELSADERTAIAQVKYDEDELHAETGVPQSWGEPDYTILERIGARPTLEITGIAGGYYGAGFKTVITQKAIAKISCRLVADQDPDTIFTLLQNHIADITPPTVKSELIKLGGGRWASMDIDNPIMQSAVEAYKNGWGYEPVFMREGGSIPIVAHMQENIGAPVVMMGFGLNTDSLHAPNEHFSLDHFHRGIQTSIHFIYEVSKQ